MTALTNLEKLEKLKALEKAINRRSTPELMLLHKNVSDSIDNDALINDLILKSLVDKYRKPVPDVVLTKTAGHIDQALLKAVKPESEDKTIQLEEVEPENSSYDLTMQILQRKYGKG